MLCASNTGQPWACLGAIRISVPYRAKYKAFHMAYRVRLE